MPTGGAVVDAFKNLIRHGKHHNHAKNEAPPPSHSPTRVQQQHQAQPLDAQPSHTDTLMAADPREAAEKIVSEEREAKAKMPTYKGLEQFQLVDKMGDGAFSNVYKANDLVSGKKVAVKVVRKYELNASQRANILKEVQIMRGTHHPSIVKLISFSESQEHYFLVLELMEGGELFHQIVKLTYFSENLARHVIMQVAQGIRYLHEDRGVVHRDIKPENLLFDRIPIVPSKVPIQRPYDEDKEDEGEFIPGVGGGGIGRVKIADFGLSKVVWDEQTMTPCGTVGYTAPEIVKDERYSKSVDMWALGCVLYTLLCGFPPFYDESINVLTEKVARGYYTFLSPWWDDISASAKDLISHLLCVDPGARYTIDEFLQHPWCTAAPAPPPPPTPYIYGSGPGSARPLDSPLLSAARGGRVEGRSPGIATLKEAFDITYAVHRMEEEGKRRNIRGAGARGYLGGLNEDDEDGNSDDDGIDRGVMHSAGIPGHSDRPQGKGNVVGEVPRREVGAGRAGPRDQGYAGRRNGVTGTKAFELDMDGATLLGRRHKRTVVPASPLSGKPMGSPLKLDSLRVNDIQDGQTDRTRLGSPMNIG